MPNAATLSRAVETATKCLATAALRDSSSSAVPSCSQSQVRARRALVSVSRVPNVFDATMNSVVVGSRPLTVSARSLGSMLETNRTSRPSCTYGLSAS